VTTERAGTVGARWETELRRYEVVVEDDRDSGPYGRDDPPTPNRATRRRLARQARRNR
jgi:hypothetical protein